VEQFIALTYGAYFEAFPEHFGRTIDSAFYDEPTFHWVEGGRAWTGAFNEKFEKRHGFHPATLYPALWFDIGKDTAAARNALLGFRAELYASGFPKTVNEWCRGHGIRLTGHVDQEEIVNPVGLCGDLIKAFEHQDIPAVDQIFFYGRASKAYKVVSSAAYNFDRRLVLTECYGAMKEMPKANLYKEAMDQFAKGINVMVPHAVWYDDGNVIFPPELSPRSPAYGPELSAYNTYVARLQRMLQQGRHVADIGVLYPIATLQAGYRFGEGKPYTGGVIPPEADYMDVGERLSLEVRRDFTFIHPEVLDCKCRIEGATLELANAVNRETYRVFIIPGSTAIALGNLEKIKAFFDNGGRVIATTVLPSRSAEFGKDGEVARIVEHIFGAEAARAGASIVAHEPDGDQGESIAPGAPRWFAHSNDAGGKAWFVPSPDAAILKQVLDEALTVYDVAFESDPAIQGGSLSYIHKVMGGRDVYFLANSSDAAVETCLRLRGKMEPELWDPHTGVIRDAEYTHEMLAGEEITRIPLVLPPVRSLFIVATAR
jgi:hypothetical protein